MNNYTIYEPYRGIFYIEGVMGFSVQVVVSKLLSKNSQKWITLLNGGLSKEEAKRAVIQANMLVRKDEIELADSVLQVAISKNREIFDLVKEEGGYMCEALRQLMEPEFTQAVNEARVEAEREGRVEGERDFAALVAYLLKDGLTDILSKVTEDVKLREEYYTKYGIR